MGDKDQDIVIETEHASREVDPEGDGEAVARPDRKGKKMERKKIKFTMS